MRRRSSNRQISPREIERNIQYEETKQIQQVKKNVMWSICYWAVLLMLCCTALSLIVGCVYFSPTLVKQFISNVMQELVLPLLNGSLTVGTALLSSAIATSQNATLSAMHATEIVTTYARCKLICPGVDSDFCYSCFNEPKPPTKLDVVDKPREIQDTTSFPTQVVNAMDSCLTSIRLLYEVIFERTTSVKEIPKISSDLNGVCGDLRVNGLEEEAMLCTEARKILDDSILIRVGFDKVKKSVRESFYEFKTMRSQNRDTMYDYTTWKRMMLSTNKNIKLCYTEGKEVVRSFDAVLEKVDQIIDSLQKRQALYNQETTDKTKTIYTCDDYGAMSRMLGSYPTVCKLYGRLHEIGLKLSKIKELYLDNLISFAQQLPAPYRHFDQEISQVDERQQFLLNMDEETFKKFSVENTHRLQGILELIPSTSEKDNKTQ